MDESETPESGRKKRLAVAGVVLLVVACLLGVVQIIDTRSDLDQAERQIRRLQTNLRTAEDVAYDSQREVEALASVVDRLKDFVVGEIANIGITAYSTENRVDSMERTIEALEDFAYEVSDYLG